jgi:molecular chaperone DnaK
MLRPLDLIAIAALTAALLAACATSAPPSGGSSATSTTGAPVPSASGAQPGANPSTASSPSSPEDAFLNLPSSEGVLNAIAISDGTIVAGGFVGPVFTSSIVAFEGGSWSVAEVPDEPGQVTGVAKLGGRWIAVGNGLPDNTIGFIWESADGQAWQTQQTIEDAAIYDVVAGDGVIVAVGARLDADMNATPTAWSSTDGTTWERAEVPGPDRSSMGSVATTPEGFIATGDRALGAGRPVWISTTGTTWEGLENDLSDQLLPSDIVAWGDQYVIVGASGKSGDQHPFAALSTDGRAWQRTNLSPEEGYASAAALANERLVVAGVDADRLTLWSPIDGAWSADTYEASGASINALTSDADLGLLGVGARDGKQAVWLFGKD